MSVVIHTCISENGKCPLRHIGVVHSGKHFKMLFKELFVTLFIVCVVVGAASEVPLLQAADVETWSLTCDSSSLNVNFREYDEIRDVQLFAGEDKSNLTWVVNFMKDSDTKISENENFLNYDKFPVSYFPRENTTNNTSVFLQLFTVGHPHCSSQTPRHCSAERILRNVDNLCTFTFKLNGYATIQNTTAKFATKNYTKLICCIGDGCGNGADNGVTTDRHADDSYLQMAIWHIRDNNVRRKLCRVTNGVVKPKHDGDVFYEGSLNDTGARLECHVPRELDCAEFQCQVITSTSKTLTQSLKHPKFNDNQYCQKADSPLGSATPGWMIPVAIAVPLSAAFGVVITVTARLLVYRHRRGREREIREGFPLKAASDDNDNDNDNGHNG